MDRCGGDQQARTRHAQDDYGPARRRPFGVLPRGPPRAPYRSQPGYAVPLCHLSVLRVGLVRSGQYPLPQLPEPYELPAEAVPEVVISCHSPPAAFRPLPLACPGAVSPTKAYSGCPSKVAWTEPSERLIVPNVPVTPAAVTGPVTGGQFCAHAPLHFDVVDVSGAK